MSGFKIAGSPKLPPPVERQKIKMMTPPWKMQPVPKFTRSNPSRPFSKYDLEAATIAGNNDFVQMMEDLAVSNKARQEDTKHGLPINHIEQKLKKLKRYMNASIVLMSEIEEDVASLRKAD